MIVPYIVIILATIDSFFIGSQIVYFFVSVYQYRQICLKYYTQVRKKKKNDGEKTETSRNW